MGFILASQVTARLRQRQDVGDVSSREIDMSISDREKKYWEDKGAGRAFEGKSNNNPHRAQNAIIDAGDSVFGAILGPNGRMEREASFDRGYKNAKKGK
jgi:hypothetical protein